MCGKLIACIEIAGLATKVLHQRFSHDGSPPSGHRVHIDVVSDVVCPWCYIGKRRLEAAMALDARYRGRDQLAAVFPQCLDPARRHRPADLSGNEIRLGRALYRDRRAHLRRRRDGRPPLQSRQDQPAAEHARLPPPHPVVERRHRSRPHEAAADGALFRRRRAISAIPRC